MIKLRRSYLRFLLALTMLFNAAAQASFDDHGVGARAPGMADAFVGAADDVNAVYYNSAGLIQVGERQLAAQYGQYLRGLSDGSNITGSYLAYSHPLEKGDRGTLGFAYHNFNVSNLLTERTLMLGYGWRLNLAGFGWTGIPSMGVTLKQLHREYQPDRFTENALNDVGSATDSSDPLFGSNGNSKDAYSADIGGLYQFGRGYNTSVGFQLKNVNRPDLSLGGDGDKAPLITKIGFAYRPAWGLVTGEMRRASRLESVTDTDYLAGVERKFSLAEFGYLALRGGYGQGSRGFRTMTAGASWLLSKVQVDYAFSFPVGNLNATDGSHRFGLLVHMGAAGSALAKQAMSSAALITAFANDSSAMHVVMHRVCEYRKLSPQMRSVLLRALIRKFPADDPGMNAIKKDLMSLIKDPTELMVDWPQLKSMLLKGVSSEDIGNADEALQAFAKGETRHALARFALMNPTSRRAPGVSAVALMGLGEMAAKAYRARALDNCIDNVRQILDALPNDDVIEKAYRELLVMNTRAPRTATYEREDVNLPEAPSTLTAPEIGSVAQESKDVSTARNFGNALGYYFTRKAEGASNEERKILLQQMKAVFADSGMDLTLINKELADVELATGEEAPANYVTPLKKQPAPPKTKGKHPTQPVKPESVVEDKDAPATEPAVKEGTITVEDIQVEPPKQPAGKPASKPATKPASKPAAKPATKPSVKPSVKPVETPAVKPAMPKADKPATNSSTSTGKYQLPKEFQQSWDFYKRASARGMTDREKIEMLNAMLLKYGEEGAASINKELEKLRKRLE